MFKTVSLKEIQRKAWNDEYPPDEPLPFFGFEPSPLLKYSTHLLCAAAKTGKTELVAQLALQWKNYSILYITEESEHTWGRRMKKILAKVDVDCEMVFFINENARNLIQGIKTCRQDIIIVDTVKLLQIDDESNNALVWKKLSPLIQAIQKTNKTLILLHHTSKTVISGNDFGLSASGAMAWSGIVDVIVTVRRYSKEEHETRRQLYAVGRVDIQGSFVYQRNDDGTMTVLGNNNEAKQQAILERVVDVLTTKPQTTTEIRDKVGKPIPSLPTLRLILNGMTNNSELIREPDIEEGTVRGKKVYWRLKE